MNNEKPVFSLILPLPAGAPSLAETIESVLRQTFRAFELIIVDDGPASATLSCALSAAQEDARVRVLSSESSRSAALQGNEKVGPVSCRNAGLLTASGDYILYISAGDLLLPHALQTIFDRAVAPRHPDIVLFRLISAAAEEEVIGADYPAGYYSRKTLEKGVFPYMICDRRRKFFTPCFPADLHSRAISRRLLLRHYCREVRITCAEAHSFIHECMLYAGDAYLIDSPLYICSENPSEAAYDPDYFESNRCLMDYLNERIGDDAAIAPQLPLLKVRLLMDAVANAAKNPAGQKESVRHMARALRDTFALSGIESSTLPLLPRLFIALLKGGHYRMAMWVVSH